MYNCGSMFNCTTIGWNTLRLILISNHLELPVEAKEARSLHLDLSPFISSSCYCQSLCPGRTRGLVSQRIPFVLFLFFTDVFAET